MEIDWTKAPPTARYHAFDADGRGVYCLSEPWIERDHWQSTDGIHYSGYTLPPGQDWTQSLISRPDPLNNDEQLVFSVRAWKAAGSYYARIDAEENSNAIPTKLQHLTGKGDTPLLALADLFIQADKLVNSD